MASVPGWRPVAPGVHRSLLAGAREVLASAWLSYYQEEYRWTIVRAWTAGAWATSSYSPGRAAPIGLRVLSSGCGDVDDIVREAAVLDSLYFSFTDPWAAMLLGELGVPVKADALRALEASVRILEWARSCGPGEPRLASPPRPGRGVRVGDVLVIVDEEASGVPLGERLRSDTGRLAPGLYTIILAPEEAGVYLESPWARYMAVLGEVEALGDDPVTSMLARRLEASWYL